MRFKKKLLKTLFTLSCVTVAGVSLPSTFSPVSASEATVLDSVVGQSLDVDGYAGGQCWDLVNYYLMAQGSGGIFGGSSRAGYIGHEFQGQLNAEGFDVIINPTLSQVQPGDILNFYPGAGGSDPYYGHTLVVKNVFANGVIQTYEQNAEMGQIVAVYNRMYPEGAISSIVRKAGTKVAKTTHNSTAPLGVDYKASNITLENYQAPQYQIDTDEEEELPVEVVDTKTEAEKEAERIAKTEEIVAKISVDVHFVDAPKSILDTPQIYSKEDGNKTDVEAIVEVKENKPVLSDEVKLTTIKQNKTVDNYLVTYKHLVTDTNKEVSTEGVVANAKLQETKTTEIANETYNLVAHKTTDVNDESQVTEVGEVKDDVNGGTLVEEKQDVNKNEVLYDEEKVEKVKVSTREPNEAVSYIDTEILPLAG